jgi:hypothetical protein
VHQRNLIDFLRHCSVVHSNLNDLRLRRNQHPAEHAVDPPHVAGERASDPQRTLLTTLRRSRSLQRSPSPRPPAMLSASALSTKPDNPMIPATGDNTSFVRFRGRCAHTARRRGRAKRSYGSRAIALTVCAAVLQFEVNASPSRHPRRHRCRARKANVSPGLSRP